VSDAKICGEEFILLTDAVRQVSENRLERGHSLLVKAVSKNQTPTHLTMKMVDYQKEDHFRELVQAMRRNTTLKFLDISKASLPYDASDETCEELKAMFAENKTLEELDISGEHAHLEVAKFGIGLNIALTGLKENKALKVLRIEYQKLGLQGANTLSSVLENNTCLTEIYCEHNDINLQGFTVLLNGLQKNRSVLYLPTMDSDRETSLKTVKKEIESMRLELEPESNKHSVRRTLTSIAGHKSSPLSQPVYTPQDTQAAIQAMQDKWHRQIQRLAQYLIRNINIADGIHPDDMSETDHSEYNMTRPGTASSLAAILQLVTIESTPSVERSDLLTDALAPLVMKTGGHENGGLNVG
jgi:hypothetical protein